MANKEFQINTLKLSNPGGSDGVLTINIAGDVSIVSGAASQFITANGTLISQSQFLPMIPDEVAVASNSFSLSSTNKYKRIRVNPTSNAVSVTLPNDTDDSGWAIGDWAEIYSARQSSNALSRITFAGGSGVTIDSVDQMRRSRTSYSVVYCEKVASNRWYIAGDLIYV
jgi:hypothetical protein